MVVKRKMTREEEERLHFVKYLMFAYNLIFFLCGCALIGVGVWIVVEGSALSAIIGSYLYTAAAWGMVVGGGLVFPIAFMGCCGAITENRCMLWTFFIFLIFICAILLIVGILAGVFRTQIVEGVKDKMQRTIIDSYGVDFHNEYNRRVTNSWDRAQEKLFCCGVENNGFAIYRESKWFENYGASQDEQSGTKYGYEDQRPYVPQSCCVKDRFWRYINLELCQKWRMGPPGSPDEGAVNRALYYTGCYDAGKQYIQKHSSILIGLGITTAFFMIVGILFSIYLLRMLKRFDQPEHEAMELRERAMMGAPMAEKQPFHDMPEHMPEYDDRHMDYSTEKPQALPGLPQA